jgi:single-strand DNA-binding protein
MNRRWKDNNGETIEETTFVDVDSFGRQAELIADMKKGDPIHLEGRLRLEQWDDKETGAKRSRLVVVVENFQFLKSKDEA